MAVDSESGDGGGVGVFGRVLGGEGREGGKRGEGRRG